MDEMDKKALAKLVHEYHIHDLLDALAETIENEVDTLVDEHEGHPYPITKEMIRVVHHLDIFARS